MDSYSVLNDQHPAHRNNGRPSRFIMAVLAASLLANAYFLLERRLLPSFETEAIASEESRQQASAPEAVEQAQNAGPVVEVAESADVESPAVQVEKPKESVEKKFQVQRASFFAPDEFPGREIKALHFSVRGSLTNTLCQLMPEPDCQRVSAYLGRLLMWRLDVNRHMRRGDTVSLVYERLKEEDDIRILRLEFDSGYLKEKLIANYYQPSGASYGTYYDENGRELALRLQERRSPLHDYTEITSLPGDYRAGTFAGHSGTDFKAEVGTPVRAPFEARVTRVNWNRGNNGLCVELEHPREGVKTLYLHLNRVQVKPGQYVKPGDIIGEVGNTGHSFAPHLHYEVRALKNRNKILNPFKAKIHPTYHKQVKDAAGFKKTAERYASILQNSLS